MTRGTRPRWSNCARKRRSSSADPRRGTRPIPRGRLTGRTTQSGLVCRHHLSAHAPELPVSRGDHGLVHAQGAGLAHLEHIGGRLLRRGTERGDPPLRAARDREHRSGQPVHVLRMDRQAEASRNPDLDGRQRDDASMACPYEVVRLQS
jgi:hypothetical protein